MGGQGGRPPGTPVRVFLADDHSLVRTGLRALIEAQEDMCVVGEASDGLEVLANIDAARPDVVLMDLAMPKLGGAEATKRLATSHPNIKVLALTAHEERGYVQSLFAAGARGYLLKRALADELAAAVRAVAAGGIYVDPAIAAYVVNVPPRDSEAATAELSERESEVLRGIAEGHAMKEIASTLGISPRTLETYRTRGMEKLGLKSRAELVRYALQRGWLTND
jgi:DNA-binding NarL/FixJ family response regulator